MREIENNDKLYKPFLFQGQTLKRGRGVGGLRTKTVEGAKGVVQKFSSTKIIREQKRRE